MKGAEIAKGYLVNNRKIAQHTVYHIYQKNLSWQPYLYILPKTSCIDRENIY